MFAQFVHYIKYDGKTHENSQSTDRKNGFQATVFLNFYLTK